MAIDLKSEQLIPLREAPKHIPGRPHLSAVYRWMGRSSNRLESVRIGGRRWTSLEAIGRFITGCNQPGFVADGSAQAARDRRVTAAMATLRAEGIIP